MTLECTIQDMFDNYPGLFKERSDVLNHLFCVNGNGYHWENGELISNEEEMSQETVQYYEQRLINGKAHQYQKLTLREEFLYYAKMRNDEVPEKILAQIPNNVYHRRERKYRWYFKPEELEHYKSYAHLFDYPHDIRPDWAAGIEETKQMLCEDGYSF